jgi:hypothetical protein
MNADFILIALNREIRVHPRLNFLKSKIQNLKSKIRLTSQSGAFSILKGF